MADSVSINVTDVPEYVSIYISEVSGHAHNEYVNISQSSLFEMISHTSAITSVAVNISASSLFEHTTHTSLITQNALNTSDASLFRYTSQNSQLQYTSDNSLLQYTSATSNITTNAIHTSNSSLWAGTGTSATGASITLNSAGLAISVADPASVDHTHGNLALTNLSGTSASSGLSLAGPGEGAVYFSNGSGVSFSTTYSGNSTTIAASIKTDYAGTGTSATGASITLNTDGLAISFVAGTGTGADGGNIIAASGSTANSTGVLMFKNSNGISFGINGTDLTASHNGLTTAAASDHTHSQYVNTSVTSQWLTTAANSTHTHGSPTLALTNLSGTTGSASNGLTLSLSAADPAAASNAVGLGTAGTNVTWTVNTAGISLNAGAYLTTAAASNHSHGAISTVTKTGTNVSFSSASNGLTMSIPAFITTADAGGAASTHIHGSVYTVTKTGTNVVAVSASSGLSLSIPPYLTTAAASVHTHTDLANVWALAGNTAGVSTAVMGSRLNLYGSAGITLSGTGSTVRIIAATDELKTSVSSAFMHTSVSSKLAQNYQLYGNTAGTTTGTIGSKINFYGGNNITLSGTGSSIRVDAPTNGSVYFGNIVGFSWGSSISGSSTTFYLVTA